MINATEYEALSLGKMPDSFGEKQKRAGNICVSQMSPSEQTSHEDQLKVTVKNSCRKEIHPEDTSYAATQIREKFCSCYAVTTIGTGAKSPKDAVDFCSQRMGPND